MQLTLLHLGHGFTIHLAVGTAYAERVVVKEPSGDVVTEGQAAALDNEYALLRELAVPGVRRALGRGISGGKPVLYLEYFAGVTLAEFAADRRATLRERLEVAVALADALAGLHGAGLVHRDISGANVLVAADSREIRIIDLGSSVRASEVGRRLGAPVGTFEYMAPEQSGRTGQRCDHRSDLYSLGIVLYQLFVGDLPFRSAEPLDLLHKHLAERPVPPSQRAAGVPRPLNDIIMMLLDKDPEARYQTAAGVAHDLRQVLARSVADATAEPFPLRRADATAVVRAPERLYGRDEELARLLVALRRTRAGGSEFALLAGCSGTGKTALVEALRHEVTAAGGVLAAGKFDAYTRVTPYHAFVQAIEAVCARVLALPAEEYARRREATRAAVGELGHALLEVSPGLRPLLGDPPRVPVLSGADAQNRFAHVFVRLLGALAEPERPLVLFIDDLQWSDAASLGLLKQLIGGDRPRGLMLLGAYRDNEIDASHPLRVALADLERRGVPLPIVTLGDLEPADVRALLHDTLAPRAEDADVDGLAALLHRKTNGNPLFVRILLRDLIGAGHVRPSAGDHRWTWDVAALQQVAATENVVELLTRRLAQLPPRVREVVAAAACVGDRASLTLLRALLPYAAAEVDEALAVAQSEALLGVTRGEAWFVHDRVRQAAYDQLDGDERRALHLRIGRLLLAEPGGAREEAVFEAAAQFGAALELITDPVERVEVARLELAAGQRALHAGASEQAAALLASGVALLPDDAWTTLPGLAFELHRARMEAEFLCARFERADEIFAHLLAHEGSPVALADVYSLHVMQRTMQGRYGDALLAGQRILAALGFELPETIGAAELEMHLQRLEQRLAGRDLAALLAAPAVEDERVRKAAKLCGTLCPTAFFASPLYNGLLSLVAWNIVLDAGPCPGTSFPIATTPLVYYMLRADYRSGAAAAQFGLDLAARLHDRRDEANCAHVFALFTSHFTRPLGDALPVARQAFTALLEVGNVQMAGFTFFSTLGATYELGTHLAEVAAEAERALAFVRKTNNHHAEAAFVVFARLCAALTVPGGEATFDGDGFSERAHVEGLGPNQMALAYHHIYKLVLCYLLDAQDDAVRHAEQATALAPFITGFLPVVTLNQYASLAWLRRAEAAPPEERARLIERAAANQRQLAAWAAGAPMNFAHRHDLVEAELLRLRGERWEALERYELAIERAKACGQLQEAALACELAARHMLAQDKQRLARPYLLEALHSFRRWGAQAKVDQLGGAYASLLRRRPLGGTPQSVVTLDDGKGEQLSARLDVDAIAKAARLIAGELVLDRLLDRLMQVLIENTGAERGLLLLPREGGLEVAARGGSEDAAGYSSAVISYVERTHEPLVLDDAVVDPRFAGTFDAATRPRSLLCAPLLDRGALIAVVYLENNLTAGAFTAERLQITNLLAAQAALSIHNANLYATLERKIEERTHELVVKNEELERSREQLALLADELSTPLIKLGERVLLAPLIGSIDDARAATLMHRVLAGIAVERAAFLILDVTGVTRIDQGTAAHLVRIVQATRLLGASAILAGVPPAVAMSLVSLGVDLSRTTTARDLQAALAHCRA
jgi:predicted ATPase/GAF domain-containing protein